MRNFRTLAFASVSLAAIAMPAYAQDAAAEEGKSDDQIVVTGTLIRNNAPIGSQSIGVSAEAITAKAAGSTNELLGLIPQITNTFNGRFEGDARGIGAGISINRPNLRNMTNYNNASGGVTLVLMDGFRIAPMGVNQSAIDVDVIPSAVLAGIDAITDGGSSLYGADAVGGVLNFRTMRKFEGIKMDGNFGLSTTIKGYHQWDGSITAGKSWSTGNAYISAGYSSRDLILNGETTWADGLIWDAAGNSRPVNTECLSPVGTLVTYRYLSIPGVFTGWSNNPQAGGGTVPVGAACDTTPASTYLPKQSRWNVFAAISQEFSDNLDLRVTGYWVQRKTELSSYPRGFTTPAQPAPVGAPGSPGAPASSPTTVLGGTAFSFGANSAYVNTPTRLGIETWGITPELTAKLGSDWQLRTTMHFGRSYSYQAFPGVNQGLAQSYINSNALNPLNAAAASSAVIADITDFENAQQTKQQLFIARVIADGPFMSLPGGDAKIAIGAEYQDNKASSRLNQARVGVINSLPYKEFGRNSKSIFAEVSLPVATFMDLSASVRHDSYSNFGSTTNPNLGATLKPFSWLKIFGHWNTSFNAPTAVDGLGIASARTVCGIFSPTAGPTDPLGKWNKQGDCALVAEGTTAGVKPQTANTWAVGLELTPLDGLRIGGEFYSIDFKNVLGAINPQNLSTYITNPELYIYGPDAATYANFLAQLTNGAAVLGQFPNTRIAQIVDRRTTNFAKADIEGIDFHLYYGIDTKAGRFDIAVSGNRQTKNLVTTSGIISDELALIVPRFTISNSLAWKKNAVSARVTVNYSGRYRDGTTSNLGQPVVAEPFIMTNVNLGYDFGERADALGGLSLRLNVDNLFNTKPQYNRHSVTNVVSYTGWTLGRMIKFGVTKTF